MLTKFEVECILLVPLKKCITHIHGIFLNSADLYLTGSGEIVPLKAAGSLLPSNFRPFVAF